MVNIVYRALIVLNFICSTSLSLAQDWGRIWCFGDSAGIDFSNLSAPVPIISYMDCSRSSTSVGDSIHGLLIYAHTEYWPLWIQGSIRTTAIHNSNHQILINGDSLIGDGYINGLTFISKPGNDSLFYIFQCGFSPDDGVYFSLVDPYYNNVGKILQKNIQLQLANNSVLGSVNAVRHGNGRDWWIITRNWNNSNKFNLFLITPDTIMGPFIQNVGSLTTTNGSTMSISKNGDRLALVDNSGLIETYLFNRCNGQISNPVRIVSNPTVQFLGVEFSPDGNLLYVSNTNNIFGGDSLRLYQFDLTIPNPATSRQIIYLQPDPAAGGLIKRGPDDKIYFSCLDPCGWPYFDSCHSQYNENLSVISDPNNSGIACNFSPFSYYLGGKRSYWGLPNNPNYLLGPLTGSVCDSLFSSVNELKKGNSVSIFPNPCSDKLNIACNINITKKIKIYKSNFQLIYEREMNSDFTTLDLSGFDSGVYFLMVDEIYSEKIILIR